MVAWLYVQIPHEPVALNSTDLNYGKDCHFSYRRTVVFFRVLRLNQPIKTDRHEKAQ